MSDPIAAAVAAGRLAPHEAELARRLMRAEGGPPEDSWVAQVLAELPRGRVAAAAGSDDDELDAEIAALFPPRTREEAWARQDAATQQRRVMAARYGEPDAAYEGLYGGTEGDELDQAVARLTRPQP